MKRFLNLVILLSIVSNAFSQSSNVYTFRKPVSVNSTTWKFLSVTSGVDAIISITASKNATLNAIDDSSVYAYAFQPNIKYTNSMSNATDSSYLEFTINFVKRSNGSAALQTAFAMTIVDIDGPGNNNTFREFVRTSLPATSTSILNSTVTLGTDLRWLNFKSGTAQFSNVDTTNYAAMVQVNYLLTSAFKMRVGVLGKIGAGDTRQASFYFKPFSALVVPLPVTLNHFETELIDNNSELNWSTASEEKVSKFEIMRSLDGINYQSVGSVNAKGNSNEINQYQFTDLNVAAFNTAKVFYQLKMIDENGAYKLSNIAQLRMNEKVTSTVSVYPNPSSDYVNLSLSSTPDSDINVIIMDSNGKTVEQIMNPEMNGNNMKFDIRNLETGIYFIHILNNDGSTTSNKFIKR